MSIEKEKLVNLIIDLTDGGLNKWRDIQCETGLPDERCIEMEKLISEVYGEYSKRNSK